MTAKQNEKKNQPKETSSTSYSKQADTAAEEVTALFKQMLAAIQMEPTTLPISKAAQDAINKYDEIRQALATEALTEEQKAVQWPAAVALIHRQLDLPTTQPHKGA